LLSQQLSSVCFSFPSVAIFAFDSWLSLSHFPSSSLCSLFTFLPHICTILGHFFLIFFLYLLF
jgi:hypothetical protein